MVTELEKQLCEALKFLLENPDKLSALCKAQKALAAYDHKAREQKATY